MEDSTHGDHTGKSVFLITQVVEGPKKNNDIILASWTTPNETKNKKTNKPAPRKPQNKPSASANQTQARTSQTQAEKTSGAKLRRQTNQQKKEQAKE